MDMRDIKRLQIEDAFLETIKKHLPPRRRKYTCYVIDTNSIRVEGSIFFNEDPQPFEGKVIDKDERYILVQVRPTDFRIIDLKFVANSAELTVGCNIKVKPYTRRHFDGQPKFDYVRSMKSKTKQKLALFYGQSEVVLPIPEINCQTLGLMVTRINNLSGITGYRTISEILVDANAEVISVVDPKSDQIGKVLPEIKFKVNSKKLKGYLTISCDQSGELYEIKTFNEKDVMLSESINLTWDKLADRFIKLIDDGSWQKTIVEVLPE